MKNNLCNIKHKFSSNIEHGKETKCLRCGKKFMVHGVDIINNKLFIKDVNNIVNKKIENYMELCFVVAKNSPDPNTKIGSILTDSRGRIIGMGYNGYLRDSDNDFPLERGSGSGYIDSKYSFVTHAELNAIHNCSVVPHHIGGAIAYVNGRCCYNCVRELWQFGVHTIYQGDIQPSMINNEHQKVIDKIVEKTGLKIIDVNCSLFSWRKNYK